MRSGTERAAAQLSEPRPDAQSIDASRAAVNQNQAASFPLAVVQQQCVTVLRGEGFECEHGAPSDRLDRAQDVDEPRPLEVPLAAQIGGGSAQNLLDPRRTAEQFAMAGE